MPNTRLAYAVLDYIAAHPDEWNQKIWTCGTKGCFAGWTTVLGQPEARVKFRPAIYNLFGRKPGSIIRVDGQPRMVKQTAIELLGITDYEASLLFGEYNTFSDLKRHVRVIFGERPAPGIDDLPTNTTEPMDTGDRDGIIDILIDQVAEHRRAINSIEDRLTQLQRVASAGRVAD